MFFSLQDVINWLIIYKYLVIFPITIVEGPAISIIAGFLSAHGILNLYLVYLVLVLGDLTGDTLYYLIGRWSRKSFLLKWGRFFGVTEEKLIKLEKHYEEHSGKTLIFGKISHAFGSAFLIAAGAAKMPLGRFLWFNLIATVPKSLIYLLIGYYFGEAYRRIVYYLDYAGIISVAVAVILVFIYFVVVKMARETLNKE
ncbi:MAG: DedA family protein [Candidatus Moraniibacteriota bacterium]